MARTIRTNIVIPGGVPVSSMLAAISKVREYGAAEVHVGTTNVVIIATWTEEDDCVRGDETEEEIENLEKRGISPVKVVNP